MVGFTLQLDNVALSSLTDSLGWIPPGEKAGGVFCGVFEVAPPQGERLREIVPDLGKEGAFVYFQDAPAVELFQRDELLKCCDVDHHMREVELLHRAVVRRPDPELDEDVRLTRVKHFLVPAALFEAVVRESHLTRQARGTLQWFAFTMIRHQSDAGSDG